MEFTTIKIRLVWSIFFNHWKFLGLIYLKLFNQQFIELSEIIYIYISKSSTFRVKYIIMEIIVIRNGKIVWKHGPYWWYFWLNMKFLGWPYRKYIKTAKMDACSDELLCGDNFDAALATFLLIQCKSFWGSWKDRYRWKRLSQILPLRYSWGSHIISVTVEIENFAALKHIKCS